MNACDVSALDIFTTNSKILLFLKSNSFKKKNPKFLINEIQNELAEDKGVVKKVYIEYNLFIFSYCRDNLNGIVVKSQNFNLTDNKLLIKACKKIRFFSTEILFGMGDHVLVNQIYVTEVLQRLLVSRVTVSNSPLPWRR